MLDLTRQNRFNRLYSTGFKYYEIQHYADAVPALRACTQMDSTNLDVWYLLAMCYYQIDSLAAARGAYEAILRQDPEQIHALSSAASIYHQLGETALLQQTYERLVELDPDNPEYREYMLAYRQGGDSAGQLRMLQRQVEQNPDDPDVHRRMAEIYARQGDTQAQIGALEEAVQRDPGQTGTIERLARLYANQPDRLQDATDAYGRLTRLRPEDPEAWQIWGQFLGRVGQPDSAITALVRALELGPDRIRIYRELALMLVDQERYEEALTWVQQAIERYPDDGHAYVTWGDILQARGLAGTAEDGTVPYEMKIILEQAIEKYREGLARENLPLDVRRYAEQEVEKLEPFRRTQAEIFMQRARDRTIPPIPPASDPPPTR